MSLRVLLYPFPSCRAIPSVTKHLYNLLITIKIGERSGAAGEMATIELHAD